MKINFILVKKSLIAILTSIALFSFIALVLAVLSYPKPLHNSYGEIVGSDFIEPQNPQKLLKSSLGSFDYQVIGFRAAKERASIVVKRDKQTYVVQQGELLENKYKLISVDSEFAIFNQNGKSYQLSTNLKIDN